MLLRKHISLGNEYTEDIVKITTEVISVDDKVKSSSSIVTDNIKNVKGIFNDDLNNYRLNENRLISDETKWSAIITFATFKAVLTGTSTI